MRMAGMCTSLLQLPRCRIHTLANSWQKTLRSLNRSDGDCSNFKVFCSGKYKPEGHIRGYSKRTVSTQTEGNKEILISKTRIRHEISEETANTRLNVYASETTEAKMTQYCDIRELLAEREDLADLVTVIAIDIETTGFSREKDRIVEIALRDLKGGENSTFQTLVNPEQNVANAHIHGISTEMVNRSDVPRMKDLIPIILQYIGSRHKPGGYVLLVAHNARSFDVPFLKSEFSRCCFKIPSNWLFLDSIPLAREVMKSEESKGLSKVSLEALGEYYKIPKVGSAHRAMADVHMLVAVLRMLTFDLKLTLLDLVKRTFLPSDPISSKKKKSSTKT